MDALVRATPTEQAARDKAATDSASAYGAGYADGITLLHGGTGSQSPVEPLRRTRARYLSHARMANPSPGDRAYIAGFRDVAADHLFCLPCETGSEVQGIAP